MHGIQFVDDDALPAGHDFMLVTGPGGNMIFYRESAVTPSNLEDSWAAYRALQAAPPGSPSQAREASLHRLVRTSRLAG